MLKTSKNKVATISNKDDIEELERKIRLSATKTSRVLSELLSQHDDLFVLNRLRFEAVGCDPVEENRPINFIEQLNQSFTYLVSLRAVDYLLSKHPEAIPYTLNLGTTSGLDIVSRDGTIVAETFAATTPESNRKVNKDIEKVKKSKAVHKYVFYYSPVRNDGLYMIEDVCIVPLKDLGAKSSR